MSAGGDADNRTGDGKIKAATARCWVGSASVCLHSNFEPATRLARKVAGRLFRQSSVWNQGFKRQRSPLPTSLGRILPAWRQLLQGSRLERPAPPTSCPDPPVDEPILCSQTVEACCAQMRTNCEKLARSHGATLTSLADS